MSKISSWNAQQLLRIVQSFAKENNGVCNWKFYFDLFFNAKLSIKTRFFDRLRKRTTMAFATGSFILTRFLILQTFDKNAQLKIMSLKKRN